MPLHIFLKPMNENDLLLKKLTRNNAGGSEQQRRTPRTI